MKRSMALFATVALLALFSLSSCSEVAEQVQLLTFDEFMDRVETVESGEVLEFRLTDLMPADRTQLLEHIGVDSESIGVDDSTWTFTRTYYEGSRSPSVCWTDTWFHDHSSSCWYDVYTDSDYNVAYSGTCPHGFPYAYYHFLLRRCHRCTGFIYQVKTYYHETGLTESGPS